MEAKIIKGLPIAEVIREELRNEINILNSKEKNLKLAVILVGNDPGSILYAQNKIKVGEKVGIIIELQQFSEEIQEKQLVAHIHTLNSDSTVNGILIELPLPKHINKAQILNVISPLKDVDGVTAVNRGLILGGQEGASLTPATPIACIELLQRSGIELRGRKVTIVGRGDTVGRPLAALLVNRDATVTICHTKTVNLGEECRRADILIAAAGCKHLIKADMVKPNTVVIDDGINQLENGSFTGDVDFTAVKEVAAVITPVPGGVGSLTTTLIMANTLKAFKMQQRMGDAENEYL